MLGHALVEHIPASPAGALLGLFLVAVIADRWPSPSASRQGPGAAREVPPGLALDSWAGRLSPAQMATRALAVGIAGLAVVAGRVGSEDQLRNIAPALVVGAGWPLLILGSLALGPVWRWLDPWDGVGRALGLREVAPQTLAPSSEHVWPALAPALLWRWYLGAYADALSPRAVGGAMGVYSIVTVAGCLAFGRVAWLSRAEVFGLLFGWAARLRRGRLVSWTPPAGAEAVLGALAGGLLFGVVRRSSLWGTLNVVPLSTLYATAGVVVACALGAGTVVALERWARRLGAAGSVAAAVVPAVAAVIIGVAMARNRLLTSVQLLPVLASDPFGAGWDLFGTAEWAIQPDPIGDGGRALVQALALVAGHGLGAVVLGRRVRREVRLPAALALSALLASSALALALALALSLR
ncbi:MAG: hypothetical protein ACRDGU_02875 [Actinomycetota bacterium]